MQQIMELLLQQEDVTWKSILYDLVKSEQMNPWDVDIGLLTGRYIQVIRQMQEHDLRISGKVLLAAAFLLKMKSAYLLEHDITNLDRLLNQSDGIDEEDLFEELDGGQRRLRQQFQLVPRNPQPRTRKVSIQDLVDALQRAMASKHRILARQRPVQFPLPQRKLDIMGVIRELYHKIVYLTQNDGKTQKNGSRLTFTSLLPAKAGRYEKAYTFIPLLHLENQRKVETEQEQHFGEIYVKLLKENKVDGGKQ